MKQSEAVEIVAKQICVYDTKIKQVSMQASMSPALWKVRNTESKQASARNCSKNRFGKSQACELGAKREASLAPGFKAGFESSLEAIEIATKQKIEGRRKMLEASLES